MPSIANTALLLQLEAYIAENNIRRGIQTVVANVQGGDSGLEDRSKLLAPAEAFTHTGLTNNKATVIKVSAPVTVDLTNADGTLTFTVASLFVFTDNITSLIITNPGAAGTTPVRLRILQI